MKYILKDEAGNVGQTLPIRQGEIKTVTVYLFHDDGTPFVAPFTVLELIVKVFVAALQSPIQKKYSLSEVTLLTGFGGTAGFQFTLTGANTAAINASATVGMTATLEDAALSPAAIEKVDFPSAFSVQAPLVP